MAIKMSDIKSSRKEKRMQYIDLVCFVFLIEYHYIFIDQV